MNLATFLANTTSRRPDHIAIRFQDQTVTYSELNRRVNSLAWGISAVGVKPADVCVLMMPNSINWVTVYYALAKLGAVVLPVNFLYRVGELDHIFQDSGARAFIGDRLIWTQARQGNGRPGGWQGRPEFLRSQGKKREVAAIVVLRPGANATPEEIRSFVKERVAPYKYPRLIKFVKDLPKSVTGKILKRAIDLEFQESSR